MVSVCVPVALASSPIFLKRPLQNLLYVRQSSDIWLVA
jgi:hypothetical protein